MWCWRWLLWVLWTAEDQSVNPKGNQSWIFFGRTDAEAETPILWPPDAKNWLLGKDPDAGKDWKQEEKGMTEDEMVGITNSMDMGLVGLRELVMDREAWSAAVNEVPRSRTRLSAWTELNNLLHISSHLPLSYCEECCFENRCANISKILLSVILVIYPVVELLLISC